MVQSNRSHEKTNPQIQVIRKIHIKSKSIPPTWWISPLSKKENSGKKKKTSRNSSNGDISPWFLSSSSRLSEKYSGTSGLSELSHSPAKSIVAGDCWCTSNNTNRHALVHVGGLLHVLKKCKRHRGSQLCRCQHTVSHWDLLQRHQAAICHIESFWPTLLAQMHLFRKQIATYGPLPTSPRLRTCSF